MRGQGTTRLGCAEGRRVLRLSRRGFLQAGLLGAAGLSLADLLRAEARASAGSTRKTSVIILWMLTFVVGLGGFAHCIATSGEILAAVLTHQYSLVGYFKWLALAVTGNVCGGVVMVTLLEYGQAIYGKADERGEQQS